MTALCLANDDWYVAVGTVPYFIPEALRLRLKAEVHRQPITQRELAAACEVTEANISHILAEPPRVQTTTILPTLCQKLGIDMWEYLVGDDSQRKILKALEAVRMKVGDALAEQFAAEAEKLSRRMIAESMMPNDDDSPAPEHADPSLAASRYRPRRRRPRTGKTSFDAYYGWRLIDYGCRLKH